MCLNVYVLIAVTEICQCVVFSIPFTSTSGDHRHSRRGSELETGPGLLFLFAVVVQGIYSELHLPWSPGPKVSVTSVVWR